MLIIKLYMKAKLKLLPPFRKLEKMTNPTMGLNGNLHRKHLYRIVMWKLPNSIVTLEFKFTEQYHGTEGPMVVEDARHFTSLRSAFLKSENELQSLFQLGSIPERFEDSPRITASNLASLITMHR